MLVELLPPAAAVEGAPASEQVEVSLRGGLHLRMVMASDDAALARVVPRVRALEGR